MQHFNILNFFPDTPQHDDSDSDSVSLPSYSNDPLPLVVSVTIVYLWLHPIFDLLNLRPTKTPQVLITNDCDQWETGSIVVDIPKEFELDPNSNIILVLPWEDVWEDKTVYLASVKFDNVM